MRVLVPLLHEVVGLVFWISMLGRLCRIESDRFWGAVRRGGCVVREWTHGRGVMIKYAVSWMCEDS